LRQPGSENTQASDDAFEVLFTASHDQQLTTELDVDLHALYREYTRPGKFKNIVEASPPKTKLILSEIKTPLPKFEMLTL